MLIVGAYVSPLKVPQYDKLSILNLIQTCRNNFLTRSVSGLHNCWPWPHLPSFYSWCMAPQHCTMTICFQCNQLFSCLFFSSISDISANTHFFVCPDQHNDMSKPEETKLQLLPWLRLLSMKSVTNTQWATYEMQLALFKHMDRESDNWEIHNHTIRKPSYLLLTQAKRPNL